MCHAGYPPHPLAQSAQTQAQALVPGQMTSKQAWHHMCPHGVPQGTENVSLFACLAVFHCPVTKVCKGTSGRQAWSTVLHAKLPPTTGLLGTNVLIGAGMIWFFELLMLN